MIVNQEKIRLSWISSRKEDIDVVANKTDFNILTRDVMLISIVIYLILQALIHVYRDEH